MKKIYSTKTLDNKRNFDSMNTGSQIINIIQKQQNAMNKSSTQLKLNFQKQEDEFEINEKYQRQ